MEKPDSPSCQRNQDPILNVLKQVLSGNSQNLLEIASGTGQHAVYMAPYLPKVNWTTSDLKSKHQGIKLWLEETNLANVKGPVEFEIGKDDFPQGDFDVIYTANSFHIMSLEKVKLLIEMLGKNLAKDALVIIYGPFNYGDAYLSKSNEDFDKWLFEKDSLSAIRNFEDIVEIMKQNGLEFFKDFDMPSNNKTLIFKTS